MKIFVIGLNKTGTMSLHAALKVLGIRSLHDWRRCSEVAEYALDGQRHPLLDQYDAFLDGRLHEAYQPLSQQHPEARFVLTTRDKEEWMVSRICHVLYNRVSGDSMWREIATASWSRQWDAHYREAESFFAGTSRCLTIDICAGEGWERLCPFLDMPVPVRPFPVVNDTKEKFSRLEKCPCCRRAFGNRGEHGERRPVTP